MSKDPTDSGQFHEVPSPGRRVKKRVGWHTSSGGGDRSSSEPLDVPIEGRLSRASTAISGDWPPDQEGTNSKPLFAGFLPTTVYSGAPDAGELRLALNKILTAEQDGPKQQQQQRAQPQTPLNAEDFVSPGVPRPVLRRNTSYNAPQEQEEADKAEKQASERQVRSLTDARQRADQLAVSVGTLYSRSAPGSRRSSSEFEASFQPLMAVLDDRNPSRTNDATISSRLGDVVTQCIPHSSRRHQPLHRDHDAAEALVRTHTMKSKHHLFHQAPSTSSGRVTPVNMQEYAQDYVPRPATYRGGVLSSLLKLYHDENDPSRGSGSSGLNTPVSLPSTPVMSPQPSPPTSRRSSTLGSTRSRPPSRLRNYHKSQHSTSSLALSELMKSSSIFAAPGSTEISDHLAEKIRKGKPTPKPKKDQIRITFHIAGIIARHHYLLKLCRALMLYGAPTHRLEEYMTMSSRVLEIEGQFLYLPSCMIISFDDSSTHTAEVKLVRVPQGVDLGRLRDVHNIYKDVVHDKLGVEEATQRLDEVMNRRHKFSTFFRVLMYGIASVCVAPFAFEGRFIDLPFCFLLGCLVGVLQLVFAPSNELYAHVFEVSAAVITSFIARGFGSIQKGELFCFSALAQSSIALILPGYMVLCSSLELQSHNIVAGSVRMVHAMIYTLFLGYGITVGASLYGMLDSQAASATHCNSPLSRGWYFLFVPGFTLCLCIINQAKWKQTPVMTAMALAGFCVNSYCSQYFEGNSQISNMLGALTVGILANLYSRLGRHMQNAWLDLVEWWKFKARPRFSKKALGTRLDLEAQAEAPPVAIQQQPRKVGYSLAAAAMLPAIFVQVPSGLAAGGSLLAGINSANQLNKNTSSVQNGAQALGSLDGTPFAVLFSVIQVAIGISVGLFLSALIVYPLGKRRSGLFSF